MFNQRFRTALLLTMGLVPSVASADWPRWRGPADHGSVEVGEYPTDLREQSVAWKADLPGKGCSTPIVVENVIYVTAPDNGVETCESPALFF